MQASIPIGPSSTHTHQTHRQWFRFAVHVPNPLLATCTHSLPNATADDQPNPKSNHPRISLTNKLIKQQRENAKERKNMKFSVIFIFSFFLCRFYYYSNKFRVKRWETKPGLWRWHGMWETIPFFFFFFSKFNLLGCCCCLRSQEGNKCLQHQCSKGSEHN